MIEGVSYEQTYMVLGLIHSFDQLPLKETGERAPGCTSGTGEVRG